MRRVALDHRFVVRPVPRARTGVSCGRSGHGAATARALWANMVDLLGTAPYARSFGKSGQNL